MTTKMNTKETQFTRLIREHKGTIYTVSMMFANGSDEVEELVQEILIRLWQGYDSFQGRSGIRTWVWRVAMNTCISSDRKKRRRPGTAHLPETPGMDIIDSCDRPEDDRQIRMLHDRIHRLGLFDRAIVLLWLEDMSYEEIGGIVGISAKNVSVRLVRIREQLKKMK